MRNGSAPITTLMSLREQVPMRVRTENVLSMIPAWIVGN